MLMRREEGQTMTEYAVVLAIITPAIILGFAVLSGGVENAINAITGLL